MILSAYQAIWDSRNSSMFFLFLVERFSEFGALFEGLIFPGDPSASFTYDDNCPLWIRINFSF